MTTRLQIEGVSIEILRKPIKRIYLRVLPPDGRVRMSAPNHAPLPVLRAFARSKLNWIRRKQAEVRSRERALGTLQLPRYVDGERLWLWGVRVPLRVDASASRAGISQDAECLQLRVRPGTSQEKRGAIVEAWYREQVLDAAKHLLAEWEPRLGVQTSRVSVRRMKTRWGSCTPGRRTIRLNTELASRPPECLEFILVHELVHLLEPSHNSRFYALMDRYLPDWRERRELLERGAHREQR